MMGVFVKTNEKNVNVIWLASDTPDDYNNRHDTFLILISPGKPWLKNQNYIKQLMMVTLQKKTTT